MSNVVLRNCLDNNVIVKGDASFVSQLEGGLLPNIGKVVRFEEYPCDCFTITSDIEVGDSDQLTIRTIYDNCYACTNGIEYYQLVDCATGDVYQQSGLPARFAFTGQSVEQNHPDLLLGKTISSILDINMNNIQGCWRFEEADEFPEYTTIPYENFFDNVVTECSCEDCLPEPEPEEPVYVPPTIYPEFNVPYCDPDYVEQIKCDYSEQVYKKMMSDRFKIKHCCNDTLDELYIKHQILELDMIEDPDLCTTTCCNCYTITVTPEVLALATGNQISGFNGTMLVYVKYCGETNFTTLTYNTEQSVTLCLACAPVTGYMLNNAFVETQNHTLNGTCSESQPCT